MLQSEDLKQNRISEAGLWDAFDALDSNHDGVISQLEIDAAVSDSDLDPRWASAVVVFKSQFADVMALHSEAWFQRRGGISKADVSDLARLLAQHPGDDGDDAAPPPAFQRHCEQRTRFGF